MNDIKISNSGSVGDVFKRCGLNEECRLKEEIRAKTISGQGRMIAGLGLSVRVRAMYIAFRLAIGQQ